MSAIAPAGNAVRLITDTLEIGVVILDAERRILVWNRWMVLRSGLNAEDAVGRLLDEALPEAANTRLSQAVDQAIGFHLPAILSPALHGTLLKLYAAPKEKALDQRMRQLIHVLPLREADCQGACLIQISDVTAAVTREKVLRQQAENLRLSTTRDSLTGLANRRHFDEQLAAALRQAQTRSTPLSLIITDLDRFSLFNSHYGKARADGCLAEIAAVLRSIPVPPDSVVARYGIDEFAFILPEQDERSASALAETIRLRIGTLGIPNAAISPNAQLTASLGVTTLIPGDDAGTDTLLSMADVALFQAKQEGRNRAILFAAEEGAFRACG